MREIQYTKYRSVKNQTDNGIRKELNEFNNSINDVLMMFIIKSNLKLKKWLSLMEIEMG